MCHLSLKLPHEEGSGDTAGQEGGTLAELCFRRYFPALSFAIPHKESKLDDKIGNRSSPKNVTLKTNNDWKGVCTNLECAAKCLVLFVLCLKAEQAAMSEIIYKCTHVCAHTQTQSSTFASQSAVACTLHMEYHVCAKGPSSEGVVLSGPTKERIIAIYIAGKPERLQKRD